MLAEGFWITIFTIGVVQGVFLFGALLARRGSNRMAVRALAAIVAVLTVMIIGVWLRQVLAPGLAALVLLLNINTELAIGPLFLLFVRSILDPDRRWSRRDGLHFLPLILGLVAGGVLWIGLGYGSAPAALHDLQAVLKGYTLLKAAFLLTYAVFVYRTLARGLREPRRFAVGRRPVRLHWLKGWLLVLGGMAATIYAAEFAGIVGIQIPIESDAYGSLLLAAMIYLGSLMVVLRPWVLSLRSTPVKVKRWSREASRVTSYLECERPWLEPELKLEGLAKALDLTENQLSMVINEGLGTLILPHDVTAPVPAVVLLHGAERATRKKFVYRMHANIFVKRGMAALLYDKRGAGDSGGDYETTTYAQLVEDAVAAVALLRRRQEIEPGKIGLVAASESGWLTPEVAERCGDIAFVINKVGPAVSVRDTMAWEVYNDLQADGASAASARQQSALFQRLWAYRMAPTPEEHNALEGALAGWAGRKDSALPTELKEVSAAYLADISYDPTPYLERLDTPFLYLYGSEDINVPTEKCVARLEALAAKGRPVSFHVYEGAGHELAAFGLLPPWYRFLDGYEDLLGGFAATHARPEDRE